MFERGPGLPVKASAPTEMLEEIDWGLSQPQKQLPSKYFYDTRGSELFEAITQLPEYYLTRTETRLLKTPVPAWVTEMAPASLVELGAGSARKTRILLAAMARGERKRTYAPVDVAGDFLRATAESLRVEDPSLEVRPHVMDIRRDLNFVDDLPGPVLFALLGSTIGNFEGKVADELLSNVRSAMAEGDLFLLGADLRPGEGKSIERLEAAYNDAQGVTAEFNLNMLHALNRDAGTNFDLAAFRHKAFYTEGKGRIEMHLVAEIAQEVQIPIGGVVQIGAGESIRTELSCKYDRRILTRMLESARLEILKWCTDESGYYAIALVSPV
jgi:L-histidine N-alpha-methyltransferase